MMIIDLKKDTRLGIPEEGGRWMIICEKHNAIIQTQTRKSARGLNKAKENFCERCNDEQQN